VISDQRIGSLFLRVEPVVPALLVDANVVRMNELAVFLRPDGELAVILVDTLPADWLNPLTETAEVAATRCRLVRQCRVIAAEFERALRHLGAASTYGQ